MIAAIFLLLAVLGTGPAQAVTTLVHSNDVLGELEPCGCRTNPLGGMKRKANLIKDIQDRFQLDAGDMLFPSQVVPELLREQSKIQARYLLKAMDLLRNTIAVPGEKDFALGFKVFEELRKKAKITYLAANLVRAPGLSQSAKLANYLPSHIILHRRNVPAGEPRRIAILGLVGEQLPWPPELHAGDPIAAAREEVRKLQPQADMIVALTHQGYEKDVELAKAVPGIQIIIGGHTQSFLQKPVRIGSTWIFQSSFRNQHIGLIPLRSANAEYSADYRLVPLDPNYDTPAGETRPMDRLVEEFKKTIAKLNHHQEAEIRRVEGKSAGSATLQTFPRCAECHLKQFDFWRKTQHVNALHALVHQKQAANKECLTCHTVGLGQAHGFNRVDRLAESREPEGKPAPIATADWDRYLLDLHRAQSLQDAIALGDRPAAPITQSLNRIHQAWTPVQCENCHQHGGEHPFSGNYSKRVENSTCLRCHTPERAPAWYTPAGQPNWELINQKRTLVACPAGELPNETP